MKYVSSRNQAIAWLAVIAMALGAYGTTYAQSNGTPLTGAVTIDSNPPGVLVHLKGEYQFIGRTPFYLPYALFGKYRIQAERRGYHTINSEHNFTGENGSVLMVKLSAKTRFKAFSRSMLFPGWGQFYSERKFMGTAFMAATTSAFIVLAINQNEYKDAQTAYETALTEFKRAGSSFEEQQKAFSKLQNAGQTLKDTEEARNTSLYITAGLWLANMLESALFFPNYAQDIEIFQKLSPTLSHAGDGVRLNMRISLD
jgi:hypothetical protein